jgi:hypothetical protein
MNQNLVDVFRANMEHPNPNGSIPLRRMQVPRAELAQRPPVQIRVRYPGQAVAQPPAALPPPQVAAVQPQANALPPQAVAVQPQANAPQNAPHNQPPQPPQGPLLPAPAPVVDPRTLLQKPHIQSTILECLTYCHRNLYDPQIQTAIYNSMTPNGRFFYHSLHPQGVPLNPLNLYKLIVKGGNTTVLLEERTAFGRANNRRNFPLSFINDLDVSLLINPFLGPVDFTIVRNLLMFYLLKFINDFLQIDAYRANVLADYAVAGVQIMPDAYSQIVHYNNEERVFSEDQITEGFLHSDSFSNIPVGSPFMVGIFRDKVYYKPRVAANGSPVLDEDGLQIRDKIKHDLTVIQIATRSMPEITLMEFAIPSKNFVHLTFEWSMSANHFLFIDGAYRFMLLNPTGIYFDQKFAAAANTRPQKRHNRTRRARQIKNRIINPRLQNGTLRQNYNTKRLFYMAHKMLTGYPIQADD